MMLRHITHFLKDDNSGQALVEFALIFPLQLVFTFGLMQLMFLMISTLMVNYAAFRCARTAVVYDCNHDAGGELNFHRGEISGAKDADAPCLTTARIILSPLSFTNTGNKNALKVPGWGDLRGSAAAADKVLVAARRQGDKVTVTLTFYQELIFPFVDNLFSFFAPGSKENIMSKGTLKGRKCFPITATTAMRAARFDVRPGADCYEYRF